MNAIEVNRLTKTFDYYKKEPGIRASLRNLFHREVLWKNAIKDVSFAIEEGEMVGVLGHNGAGKTTTLKLLSGILHPTSGAARVFGFVPSERKKEFKRIISIFMGQKSQLWPDLPAGESIYLNKCIYQIDDNAYRRTLYELSDLLDVKHLMNVQVRRLSLGERMKMEMVSSLIHKPKLIFLDEPTIGLDFISQRNVRAFLKYYNQQNKSTVLLTSHYMKDIEELCGRTILMKSGEIVYDGALKEINAAFNTRKLIKLRFSSHVAKKDLEEIGQIKDFDAYTAAVEVPKDSVRRCAQLLLEKLPVIDFNIEDMAIEDGIAELIQRNSGS